MKKLKKNFNENYGFQAFPETWLNPIGVIAALILDHFEMCTDFATNYY